MPPRQVSTMFASMWLLLFLTVSATPAAVGPGDCVVFAPVGGERTIVGGDECQRRTLPASTFKVPHALIGLQTGVITDRTVMTWDGVTRDFPVWDRDHTLDSAIKMSVLWFFQRMASSIGRERELAQLRALRYGSASFSGAVTEFWLNGDLTITPVEQVAFLERMFSYDLPVERRHIDTVKAALVMPRGKLSNAAGLHDFPLTWPVDTVARLKTGNGTVNGERVSWLVGALDTGGRQYVFASRVRKRVDVLANTGGADLAVRVLNALAPTR